MLSVLIEKTEQNDPELTSVTLSNQSFDSTEFKQFTDALAKNTSIASLNLCNLFSKSGNNIEDLVEAIKENTRLEKLVIDSNFSTQYIKQIKEARPSMRIRVVGFSPKGRLLPLDDNFCLNAPKSLNFPPPAIEFKPIALTSPLSKLSILGVLSEENESNKLQKKREEQSNSNTVAQLIF